MEIVEKSPLPQECIGCTEDCGECDHALDRWEMSRASELHALRKRKIREIDRLIEEVVGIDIELAKLEAEN